MLWCVSCVSAGGWLTAGHYWYLAPCSAGTHCDSMAVLCLQHVKLWSAEAVAGAGAVCVCVCVCVCTWLCDDEQQPIAGCVKCAEC